MNDTARNIMEQPFDGHAAAYDIDFESQAVPQHLRAIVWNILRSYFTRGDHILELNCGTGIDATMLAQQGMYVTATDASSKMIEKVNEKRALHKIENFVESRILKFEELGTLEDILYDGAFSNFGGLNCSSDLHSVVRQLASCVKPGGYFIACLLNKISLWEMTSFLLRGNMRGAFRRFHRKGTYAHVGSSSIPVWYYSPHELKRLFRPWFSVREISGLSIIAPNLNSQRFSSRYKRLALALLRIDNYLRRLPLFRSLGDHVVIVAQRARS